MFETLGGLWVAATVLLGCAASEVTTTPAAPERAARGVTTAHGSTVEIVLVGSPHPSSKAEAGEGARAPKSSAADLSSTVGAPGWITQRRRPWLGNGSAGSEVLAASQRLVGVRLPDETPFLASVLASAAIDVGVSDADGVDSARFDDRAAAALIKSGASVADPRTVRPMMLAFYRVRAGGSRTSAVVETVEADGRIHVIGVPPDEDIVRRFVIKTEDVETFTRW